jgi:hypothetical protein
MLQHFATLIFAAVMGLGGFRELGSGGNFMATYSVFPVREQAGSII